jgi:RNA polymerase sigma factor (sigma-70 family)
MEVTTEQPVGLSLTALLDLIESCRPLAHHLARKMYTLNPGTPLREFNDAATAALKVAALKYDPVRQAKFSTYAYVGIWRELINFARNESARGMHVPTDHPPYFARRPASITANWHHPRATCLADATASVNDLGEDFWRSVARTLCHRERLIIIGVFRDGKTLKAIGPELGISKQRAGQLYEAAMVKLARRDDLKELTQTRAA